MANGAASAMARTPDPAAPEGAPYFTWQPPNKSVSVRILSQVLSEIAGRSAGDPPEAAGGLLLGFVRYAGSYNVTIEAIEGIEGRFWRGFRNTDENAERRRLELALARWRPGADRPLSAVGYYRVEAAGVTLGPSNDDLMMIARYFSAPHNVFLFVRPAHDGAGPTGGLVCWQFGQIPETPNEEFSLEAPPLTPAGAPPALPEPTQIPIPERLPGAPGLIAIRRWWLVAALIALAVFAAIGIAAFLFRRSPEPRPASSVITQTSQLALTAERSGTEYRVTWDRNSPAVLFANKGLLTITDGGSSRVVELDLAQLKGGSLLYTPASRDVLIQLEVTGSGPPVTESVRVLSASPVQEAARPAPLVVKAVPPPAAPAEKAKSAEAAAEEPPVVATRAFTPPVAPTASSAVPIPPEVAGEATVQWSAPAIPVPSQPPPAERPPARQEVPKAASPARVSDYRPPRAIEQPQPVLNRFAREALIGAGNSVVQVDVEFTVDKTGRVPSIKPFTGTDAVRKTLWIVAADAVRRWKFEPARLNDQLVDGPMTVSFRFGGSGSK